MTVNTALESAAPDELSTSKLSGSDSGRYDPPQAKVAPPSPTPRNWPEAAEDVVTVPVVVVVDDDPEQDAPEQPCSTFQMSKKADVAGAIPGVVVVATSVYPLPVWLIDRPGKLATPPAAPMVGVPDSVPEPGFVPMVTVTAAVELVIRLPLPSRTSTETGLPSEPLCDVIGEPATVPFGSSWNARKQLGVTVTGKLLAWKSAVASPSSSPFVPANWLDSPGWTVHADPAPLHGAVASRLSVADWPSPRPRFRNCADPGVCEAVPPDALVRTKPPGAVRRTEPRVSLLELVTVKVKARVAPAATLAWSTVTL